MHTVESVIAGLKSVGVKRLDLGLVTSSDGHYVFIEALGIGLLAELMNVMHSVGKKRKSRLRLSPEERLTDAIRHLRLLAEENPELKCELHLDDEIVAGDFLLLEVANMPLVGPNLRLVPEADPADGWLDVIWIEAAERELLCEYLERRGRGERTLAPTKTRRCQRAFFRCANTPVHVDGKAFLTMTASLSIRLQSHALHLLDFNFPSSK